MQSPIGWLKIAGLHQGVTAIEFHDSDAGQTDFVPIELLKCKEQLQEFFAGQRTCFDLDLSPSGTPFQEQVWNALLAVPFGKTASYQDIAFAIQNEKSVRAVGAANGKNKIPIVIPCHRIIGTNGKMTGFASGIWRKKWLLEHESKARYGEQTTLF